MESLATVRFAPARTSDGTAPSTLVVEFAFLGNNTASATRERVAQLQADCLGLLDRPALVGR